MFATGLLHSFLGYLEPANLIRNAGFFLWFDLSSYLSAKTWDAEKQLKDKLAEAGIPLSSGRLYRAESPGWFRFIFTLEKDAMELAIKRYALDFLLCHLFGSKGDVELKYRIIEVIS
jgi:DNA-binding transcriptional MocR family regulator